MPLDPGDPHYRAEVIPASIDTLGRRLCTYYGVGLDHRGDRGNLIHTSGYHRSRAWILNSPDSAHGAGDYSIQLAVDKQGPQDDVSAEDFTPADWGTPDNRAKMRAMTKRAIEACQRNDPRMAAVREVAGTLDGSHVVTYDHARQQFKTPFDSSHLDHLHLSFFRGKARDDHTGVFEVLTDTGGNAVSQMLICKFTDNASVFLTDLKTSRAVSSTGELAQLWSFHHTGELDLMPRNKAADGSDVVASFPPDWKAAVLGVLLGEVPAGFEQYAPPAPANQPVQVDADAVAQALVANPALGQLIEDRSFAGSQRAESQ